MKEITAQLPLRSDRFPPRNVPARLASLLIALPLMAGCPAEETMENRCPEGWACDEELEKEGCPAGSMLAPEGGCRKVGWTECPEGFEPHGSGWGCTALIAEECEPGTRPSLGKEGCLPVGFTDCPDELEIDPSGWACTDRLGSELSCGRDERPDLVEGCVLLGDCEAPFPPPGATHEVDESFSDEELGPNRFRSLAAAVSQAPAGAVIAVEAGTYRGSLIFRRPMRVVGRCASRVIVEGPGTGLPGLAVPDPIEVEVEGLTVKSFVLGAQVEEGGTLHLRESALVANTRSGMFVLDAGTRAVLERSVVRESLPEGGRFGQGIGVAYDAHAELVDSAVLENREMGILLHRGGGADLTRSVVAGTLPRANGILGVGILCQGEGSSLAIDRGVVASNKAFGVQVTEGARASLLRTVVRDTEAGLDVEGNEAGVAVAVLNASLSMEDVTLSDVASLGLALMDASPPFEVERLTVLRAGLASPGFGVHVMGGSGRLSSAALIRVAEGGLVVGQQADVEVEGLHVLDVQGEGRPGLLVQEDSIVKAHDVAIVGAAEAGAGAVDEGTRLELTRAAILRTRPDTPDGQADEGIAVGVFVIEGAHAELESVTVRDSEAAGLAAAVRGSIVGRWVEVDGSRTLPGSGGDYGYGLVAQDEGDISLEEASIRASAGAGVLVTTRAGAALERVVIHEGATEEAGARGRGLVAQGGSRATISSSAVVDNEQMGLFSLGMNTILEADRSLIAGNEAGADGEFGTGALIAGLATAAFRECEMRNHPGQGFLVSEAALLLSSSLVVNNVVAIHLDETELVETDSEPETAEHGEVVVSGSTRFSLNEQLLDGGRITLPDLPTDLP